MLEKYRAIFNYVLVDEFQDTNYAQYRLLKLLAARDNICVVGDDDPRAYINSGALMSEIFYNFENDFPAGKGHKA